NTESIKTGGDNGVVGGIGQFVPGKLFLDELVVGLVFVKRLDYVIAITPGQRLLRVALVTGGLGETHDIEPMPSPTLAVLRERERLASPAVVGRRSADR